jgi:hypothetical protein
LALLPRNAILRLKNTWLLAGTVLVGALSVGALFLGYHVTCGSSYYSTGLCYLPRYKNWAPEISVPLKVSQSTIGRQAFSVDCNDLTSARLWIRDRGASSDPIRVNILADGSTQPVVSKLISPQSLPPSGWYEFRFPPVPDSGNKKYVLEVVPAEGTGQPDIELGYFARNEYMAGSLRINNLEQTGDLLFQYGCSVGLDQLGK